MYNNFKRKTIYPNKSAKKFKDFNWTYKAFVEALKERLNMNLDALVLVSGKTGRVKSHFVGNLCLKYFSKQENFVLNDGTKMFEEEDFITTPEEFSMKMISKTGSVLWVDESYSSLNRRSWYSKMNKTIVARKNTNRKLRNITFVLLPFEKEIDKGLTGHVNLWLWVRRGVVEIFASAPNFKGGKGLDIQAILDRDEKYRKENPNCSIVPPYIHPEYVGRIFFSKLTTNYEKKYDELVEEKKAVGELTEEEKVQMGMLNNVSPETKIKEVIKLIKNGEMSNKKELWSLLKKETELDDSKLLRQLNFYLNLEELPTFAKLFK